MTEEEKDEPLAPRKAWGDVPFQLRVLPLEVTASAMEGNHMMKILMQELCWCDKLSTSAKYQTPLVEP